MNSMTNDAQIKVLEYIYAAGKFESRLAEKSAGCAEFLQWGVPPDFFLTEVEFISLLYELRSEGYLTLSQTTCVHDSSEYICKWEITDRGIQALSN